MLSLVADLNDLQSPLLEDKKGTSLLRILRVTALENLGFSPDIRKRQGFLAVSGKRLKIVNGRKTPVARETAKATEANELLSAYNNLYKPKCCT